MREDSDDNYDGVLGPEPPDEVPRFEKVIKDKIGKVSSFYENRTDFGQYLFKIVVVAPPSILAFLYEEPIRQQAPSVDSVLTAIQGLITNDVVIVVLLGVLLGWQYSNSKRLRRVHSITYHTYQYSTEASNGEGDQNTDMDTPRTDGGRSRPRDESGRFESPDDGPRGGGLIGGAIAGAAIGSTAGPGGTIAGALIGAFVGDELEKQSKDND
ncbi:MAG: hypothetical protein U5K37_12460 [Natrialbaceae archaeon]|nr:hypothetical protein [Natrialbaceae archaeon]